MCVNCDDGKLKIDGGGVIPPLGLKGGLVVSIAVIDILPLVNTAIAETRCNKVDIDSCCIG